MFKWFKWLGLGLVVGVLALGLSVKTYIASLNRQEPKIAVIGSTHEVVFPETGEIRIYHYPLDVTDSITVKLTYNSQTSGFSLSPNSYKDTGIQVGENSIVTEQVIERLGPGYGWIPAENRQCGAPGYKINVGQYIDSAASAGKTLVSVQCWSDWDTGETESEPDHNDYLVILSYKPAVGPSPSPGKPDYCVSASASKATMLPGETLTISSSTNTPVNGFFYAAYNSDNNPAGNDPKAICTGTEAATTSCPNGGKPLIFSDPNNKTDGTGLRTNGSVPEIPYANLFVTDKSTRQQVTNIQFNAYFSLNGGPWSWPQVACVAFTKMGTPPSPSPSPNANQAMFVIHKFLDVNKNSVRETGEGTTNRTWEFEYQIDGGEKQTYTIEPGEEEGEKIIVNKGVKVKVAELGQEGWLNTTGAELTKTLADPKLYTFYFGNWPVGGVAGGFPPTQPDTGAPTWLTLSLALSIMVITIIKIILKV